MHDDSHTVTLDAQIKEFLDDDKSATTPPSSLIPLVADNRVWWEYGAPERKKLEEFKGLLTNSMYAHAWLEDEKGCVYHWTDNMASVAHLHGLRALLYNREYIVAWSKDSLKSRGLHYVAARTAELERAIFMHWVRSLSSSMPSSSVRRVESYAPATSK